MKNRDLIITLIQQDLKHHQLITNLENLITIEKGKHDLEILNVVHDLMEVPDTAELDFGKTNLFLFILNLTVN